MTKVNLMLVVIFIKANVLEENLAVFFMIQRITVAISKQEDVAGVRPASISTT